MSMSFTNYGTGTSLVDRESLAQIVSVSFAGETLIVRLNDGRAILLEMARYSWLRWLLAATPQDRCRWEVVPSGGGVWWPELDDGIELQPLLDLQPILVDKSYR
jgi:hypothetical protein